MIINNIEKFLDWVIARKLDLNYDVSRHKLRIYDQEEIVGDLWLPFSLSYNTETNGVAKVEKNWIVFLIRSGTAALGYFEEGTNTEHKVIRAYMVRKKQGKSQIKYLKTKGKSRAGSRVRLEASEKFFNDINEKLSDYLNKYPVDYIAYSCSKTLWPYLFTEEGKLKKDDPRLFKVPAHIQEPGYGKLLEINDLLQSPNLIIAEKNPDYFSAYKDKEQQAPEEDDNW
ncbi:hypothetical protein [Cyclobacterium qasimii]|uniref:VLRF1 domain-containing protein n=2 Tax=Cyclobacterium qasimii TaxID=1350429 RepID=S7WMJ7_9BACT|nr:hypothetical protein [Cyclobacterium qasimii]EPR65433.1 hypothetical protein ADICYQ_5642 [Cyclobacterium qasimii M12-11B]GEO20144.1 hypothetical protein CQA01_06780 [Cyclobacterium qasimii]